MNQQIILATLAILLPVLVALAAVRRRRAVVVAEPAAQAETAAPYWRQPYRWYRATDGRWSWMHEWKGELERGPFFTPRRALRTFNVRRGYGSVQKIASPGESMTEVSQHFIDVMCYWPVDDPRLRDDVTAREISRALERGLVLLTDDLVNFRTRSTGEPDPFLAPFRAANRLRREANDDGSWLVAADLLRDVCSKSRNIEDWIGRVVFLIRATSGS